MFDCYYCINYTKYSLKFVKNMVLYFFTIHFKLFPDNMKIEYEFSLFISLPPG